MAYRKMTDHLIVKYARRQYEGFIAGGDNPASALDKATANALTKQWRRAPIDMTQKRNLSRYGSEYAELRALVVAGNGENACS